MVPTASDGFMVQIPDGGVVVKVPTSSAIAIVHIPATSALDSNKYISVCWFI